MDAASPSSVLTRAASVLSPAAREAARGRLTQAHDLGLALLGRARGAMEAEWFGSPLHRALLLRPAPEGLAARPRELRPIHRAQGARLVQGEFFLAGDALSVGPEGDPWDRPSPSARFARSLHRYDWIADLVAEPGVGAAQALRLHLDWRRVFGGWNAFSWEAAVLERRVFNLSCAIGPMTEHASDAETAALCLDLARQARHLAKIAARPERAAERAVVVAVAGATLNDKAGEQLLGLGLKRLSRQLPRVVLADGDGAAARAVAQVYGERERADEREVGVGDRPVLAVDHLSGAEAHRLKRGLEAPVLLDEHVQQTVAATLPDVLTGHTRPCHAHATAFRKIPRGRNVSQSA